MEVDPPPPVASDSTAVSAVKFLLPVWGNVFFREMALAICHEIAHLGVTAQVIHTSDSVHPDDLVVMIAPQETVALLGEQIFSGIPSSCGLVSITADQPGTVWFENGMRVAKHFGYRFDFNRWAGIRATRAGAPTEFLPFGYHQPWDALASGQPRLTDVAFLGEATERRLRILANAESAIAGRPSCIVLSSNDVPNSVTTRGFLQGPDRRRLLARTVLHLGIHRTEIPYFEWFRMVESAHTGSVFVTEPSVHPEPFVPEEDFVVIRGGGVPQAVRNLINDPERIEEVALSARDRLKEFPLARAAERILECAGSPRLSSSRDATALPSAATDRIDDFRSGRDRLGSSVRGGHRQTLSPLKRGDLRQRILRDRDSDVASILSVEEFWQEFIDVPRVSIICPCRDGEELLERALESAACTTASVEITVVDDASGDRTFDVARRWAERTPFVPVRLIRMSENVGLARARNVALKFSRGEFFLPLDHDNELFPDSIPRLLERLVEEPDAAFSYGYLIRQTQSHNVGLLSLFPWDEARFRHGNYIDALALIRRSAFDAAVVGYRSDGRLRGWEDFDVWLRFAESGESGSFLFSPVGRYGVRPDQMSRSLAHEEYFDFLRDEYPRVFRFT